ncbi:MAG: aconitate hydratase AcnA [Cyanobacteria bacterium]|nr:aconitate hydratase AcnA [Cyanobacteriota bacterium]MDA1020881.1 aconitate hydratase AcnA [Cyanobacteriota bacterium]
MKKEFIEKLTVAGKEFNYYSLAKAETKYGDLSKLPVSLKIVLEGMLRNLDGKKIQEESIKQLVAYNPKNPEQGEVPFSPARVVLQDFTGVPLFVDLAAMRDAAKEVGLDPQQINPLVPIDLVIDHSIQVDSFGESRSKEINEKLEFERNNERFKFLKWSQQAFDNTRIVPPGFGIIHQVNMEYLASVVIERDGELLFDSCVGTDSHTTMIDGLGVFGFGVGGLEAEAAMLGQPVAIPTPEVIGVRLKGQLDPSITATDLALYVTEFLRRLDVVGKLVEFFGEGCKSLTLEERATVSNMCPEYGATVGMFPIDKEVLAYLKRTGRSAEIIESVEAYNKAQGTWGLDRNPESFTKLHEIDLADIKPSISGPRRPQDRIDFYDLKNKFAEAIKRPSAEHGLGLNDNPQDHGDVVIAAITSCTNTSNPAVIIGAGLLAKKAVEKGLTVGPKVKTSLGPGSQAVTEYLRKANLLEPLEKLGFSIVGYGCTTCIGNTGPLSDAAMDELKAHPNKVLASVLSGNRNFDGRISPHVKANFLMSPPLVVAMAIKGNMNWDPNTEPVQGDVMLADIWPNKEEIKQVIDEVMDPLMYENIYAKVSAGTELWDAIEAGTGDLYEWDTNNSYIQKPPYFDSFKLATERIESIKNARTLLSLGDSITTDHISPAGNIAKDSDAANYLREQGIDDTDFNSYGSRRGNDRVMTRGTFANIRLSNLLVPGSSGPRTKYFNGTDKTTAEAPEMSVFEASLRYHQDGVSNVVFAGKLFGNGSSRDWAAKGQKLLGVKAVIAESFERIHRSNLIGMGIMPIGVKGKVVADYGLDGSELFSIDALDDNIKPYQEIHISVTKHDGSIIEIPARVLLQTPIEVEYYRNGGILQYTLRELSAACEPVPK